MVDTKRTIECPACGCEMKKVFIEDAGVNVDICTEGCGGIYFDNRELEKFDHEGESIDEILKEIEGKEYNKIDEREVRICPICNCAMAKTGARASDVQIDVCYSCGAKFLDNGELQKIRAGKENIAKFDNLVESLYQEEAKNMLGKNYEKKPVTDGFRKLFEQFVFRKLTK